MSMYVSFDIDEKYNNAGFLVFGYVYRGVRRIQTNIIICALKFDLENVCERWVKLVIPVLFTSLFDNNLD